MKKIIFTTTLTVLALQGCTSKELVDNSDDVGIVSPEAGLIMLIPEAIEDASSGKMFEKDYWKSPFVHQNNDASENK